MPNTDLALREAMYASVEIDASAALDAVRAVVVPASAVIDSGTRQVVLVERDEGRFAPREVRVGARSRDYVELLDGVTSGEKVVVDGNFLIDLESNLRTALAALTSGKTAGVVQEGQQPEKSFSPWGSLPPSSPTVP